MELSLPVLRQIRHYNAASQQKRLNIAQIDLKTVLTTKLLEVLRNSTTLRTMSQKGKDVHPVRRRAGFLSALAKLYSAVRTLLNSEGTAEEALQIQQKLHERYTAYLESHETALVEVPLKRKKGLQVFSDLINF